MNKKTVLFFIMAAFFISSCVTVNIYFPAAAVQKAADVIVEDIRGIEKSPERQKDKKPDKESRFIQEIKSLALGTSVAYAQIDIEVSTPAIRALKESLKLRFTVLKPYYEMGAIGENNKGLIEIRDISGLNLRQKAEINRLVEQENNDRNGLYEEILKANKFGREMLSEIQRIFANSWRDKSLSNWWIQKDDSEWVRKK